MAEPLWIPHKNQVDQTHMRCFTAFVNKRHNVDLTNYDALYAWSVENIPEFWEALWDYADIRHSEPCEAILENPVMPGATWFRGARLNFAENLLRHRDERAALIAVSEGGDVRERLSYDQLYDRVARLAHFLAECGVAPGDRVVGYLPNISETVIAMLASTSLGAIWSSCSPDFGFRGVMDRFGQIAPKIIFTADGYRYNGKPVDSLERVGKVVEETPTIERVIVVPYLKEHPEIDGINNALPWHAALGNEARRIDFAQLPFDHPLYIMYSSGTTGVPKCMVHGAGGTLLQHAKELLLHTDLKRNDTIFYFTTCGWMMWNWLVSSLMAGATVVLYEGSPAHPDAEVLWRMAQKLGISVFGTSAKYIATCRKADLHPGRDHDLGALRAVLSTGSPLPAEDFEWVYARVKNDLQLASICGGTDIISCFMLGEPTSPVYAGEIQKRGLGMKVEAWSDAGEPLIGDKGELVCTRPFPSMPVRFWNDPNGEKYRDAYFSHFTGVWRHGDFIEITPRGGVIVYGRSDATLNPGGVRIGTAEIYRVVEAFDAVEDSLVVGQQWAGDVRIVLFVKLREGSELDDELERKIRTEIRESCTPRHVPAKIVTIPEIPYTINGKKVEIAVTRIIHGEKVKNRDALANPQALDHFADLKELQR